MKYPPNFRKLRKRRKPPDVLPEVMATWTAEDAKKHERAKRLGMPIASMGFPVRITNTLEGLGILVLSDLLRWTQCDLLQGGNLGVKTLREIQATLRRYGFKALSMGLPPKQEAPSREVVKRKSGDRKKT